MRNKSLFKKMFAVAFISFLLMLELSGCSTSPEPKVAEGSQASNADVKPAAQFELSPEQLENEIRQVKSALRDFYDKRRKQDFPDPVKDFAIISIGRRESAAMSVQVKEQLADGSSRENSRYVHKKNGIWSEG